MPANLPDDGRGFPALLTVECAAQRLVNEIASSAVAILQPLEPLSGLFEHYLVVGSSFSVNMALGDASVNVYKWSRQLGQFEFHHSPKPVGARKAFASKMSSLTLQRADGQPQHLLAIANFWDSESTSVPSPVLRFDASDGRFEVVASVVGSGTTDMVMAPLTGYLLGELSCAGVPPAEYACHVAYFRA